MSVYKKTLITFDPTARYSEKVPVVEVMGNTLITIKRGNNAVDVYGDTRKQTIQCAKGLIQLLQCAVADLEEKVDA